METKNLKFENQDIENIDINSMVYSDIEYTTDGYKPDYDVNDYPKLDEMLDFIRKNQDKEPVKITPNELGVNGICVKDSIEDYLATKRISAGNQKECLKSPLAFLVDYEKRFERKNAPHFELGTFAHQAFLEPELFERVVVAPDFSLASKEGVIGMINFYQELAGEVKTSFGAEWKMQDLKDRLQELKSACKFQLIQPEHKIIIDTLKYHYNNYGGGIIPRLLKGAVTEISMYGADEYTGLETKIRPDAVNFAENIGVNAVISFKTTRAESIGKFTYDCARLKYEVAEGFYQNVATQVTGRKFNATIMIILQTVPPYQPAVLWWNSESIEVGKYKSTLALSIIKECFEKNCFPGFDAKAPAGNCGIYEFDLPDWSLKEEHPTAIDDE